jgi:hypothetical protein
MLSVLTLTVCIQAPAQNYAIKDSANVLTKKEKEMLNKMIACELDFYNRVFKEDTFHPSDVNMQIFNNYAAYITYKGLVRGEREVLFRSMGCYSAKTKEVIVCKAKNEKRFLNSCFYLLSFSFIHQRMKNPPLWIGAGLAAYFRNFKISSKAVKHEKNSHYITRVKTLIDLKEIDLQDFIGWSNAQFTKRSFSDENYGYAIGYCMTAFLLEKDENIVINILRELNQKKSSKEAFDNCYEGGFDQFEKDFLAHYSGRR